MDASARLAEFLGQGAGAARDRRLRETTHAVLLMPDYQLS